MAIETKLVKTYLSHKKYLHGKFAVFVLLGLCIIFSNFHWDSSFPLSAILAAKKSLVFEQNEYWRLFTTTFVHADLKHLSSNSMMLAFLVYFVTSFYGYFISLVVSLIMGAIINYYVLYTSSADITLVGISGVIYYLWGFWLVLYVFIDQRISVIRRLINVTGIFFILLIPTSYSPQTSYLAHYFGFLVGVVTALIYYPFKAKRFKMDQFYEFRYVENLEEQDASLSQID